MTKQEALEALLAKMREWEEPGAEVPARNDRYVARQMFEAVDRFGALAGVNWRTQGGAFYLTIIGAAALYLLRDEVDVVGLPQLTEDLDAALARWTGEGGRAENH